MKIYLDLLQEVLKTGTCQANRTGIDAISVPGAMMKFDLNDGFPVVTTKKFVFKSMVAELIAFLRGYDNAAQFRELGCKFWDQNANENQKWLNNPARRGVDDLGRVYGVQWRHWRKEDGTEIDQVMNALNTIHHDPTDRRIIISAWRPDEFSLMALPPCHVMYQFIVNRERNELNLCMYQRSCDLFLGVPVNIASSALMLTLFAHLTGMKPRFFTHFLADAHVYTTHISMVEEQTKREPYPLPKIVINKRITAYDGITFRPDLINEIMPDDITLEGYQSHAKIAAPMAV